MSNYHHKATNIRSRIKSIVGQTHRNGNGMVMRCKHADGRFRLIVCWRMVADWQPGLLNVMGQNRGLARPSAECGGARTDAGCLPITVFGFRTINTYTHATQHRNEPPPPPPSTCSAYSAQILFVIMLRELMCV